MPSKWTLYNGCVASRNRLTLAHMATVPWNTGAGSENVCSKRDLARRSLSEPVSKWQLSDHLGLKSCVQDLIVEGGAWTGTACASVDSGDQAEITDWPDLAVEPEQTHTPGQPYHASAASTCPVLHICSPAAKFGYPGLPVAELDR
jgi:hypothetical protein